jgi:hypothetical protein
MPSIDRYAVLGDYQQADFFSCGCFNTCMLSQGLKQAMATSVHFHLNLLLIIIKSRTNQT